MDNITLCVLVTVIIVFGATLYFCIWKRTSKGEFYPNPYLVGEKSLIQDFCRRNPYLDIRIRFDEETMCYEIRVHDFRDNTEFSKKIDDEYFYQNSNLYDFELMLMMPVIEHYCK